MPTAAQIRHFMTAPEQFMRTHSVKWRGTSPQNQEVITVALVDAAGVARSRPHGTVLGINTPKSTGSAFDLRWNGNTMAPLQPGTTTFDVQWSGYRAGQGRDAVLPRTGGPDIMLTPEFTGCTAVCRTNADGSAQFSHYNLMSGSSTLPDDDMRAIAEAAYGGGQTTLTKGDVRAYGKHSGDVRATVVGIRRNGRWEFWAQLREQKAGNEQIRGVVRL